MNEKKGESREDIREGTAAAPRARARKRFLIMAQGDQVVEFTVAGLLYAAVPGQPLPLDEAVVNHPDFKAQAARFGITEVTS
jgi:hypothetical protein